MATEKMIHVVEDAEATGEVARVYDEWRAKSGRRMVPGIYKCFSARPDALRSLMEFSETLRLLRGPPDPAYQGGHRYLRLCHQSLSLLNRCSRLLPAGTGSGGANGAGAG